MKFTLYDVDDIERAVFIQKGLHVYDLRATDDCSAIGTIEPDVWVNNVGNIVTNEKIVFENKQDKFADYEKFAEENEEVEIEDLLPNYEQISNMIHDLELI